jgi:hypothetical protein
MGPNDINYKHPKRVRITIACVYLNNHFKPDDQGVVAKAKEMLDKHGLELDVWPAYGKKSSINTLDFGYDIIPPDAEVYKALRAAVNAKIKQGGCNFVAPMPAVFGVFKHSGLGITPPSMANKYTPACMVAPGVNVDKMTLLHEIGHGAGLPDISGAAHAKNFMFFGENRTNMYRSQVEAIAKATFAVG